MGMLIKLTNRRVFTVFGPDVVKFMQGLCTADLETFYNNTEQFSTSALFLSPKGKIMFDTIISKIPDLPTGESI
jgi:folate-binding Fe-S cluster repair protein YgfZ